MSEQKPKRIFEVSIKAYRSVIVEAEDEDDALDIVGDECTDSNWEIDEWRVENELKTEKDIKQAKECGAVDLDNW